MRPALVSGFWKGMAAPLSAYSQSPVPRVEYEFKALSTGRGDLEDDWSRIGQQIKDACEQESLLWNSNSSKYNFDTK